MIGHQDVAADGDIKFPKRAIREFNKCRMNAIKCQEVGALVYAESNEINGLIVALKNLANPRWAATKFFGGA